MLSFSFARTEVVLEELSARAFARASITLFYKLDSLLTSSNQLSNLFMSATRREWLSAVEKKFESLVGRDAVLKKRVGERKE